MLAIRHFINLGYVVVVAMCVLKDVKVPDWMPARQYRNINCSRSKRSSGIAFLPRTSVYLLVLLLINLLWEPPIRCIIKHGILGTIIDYLCTYATVGVCLHAYIPVSSSFLPIYPRAVCCLPPTATAPLRMFPPLLRWPIVISLYVRVTLRVRITYAADGIYIFNYSSTSHLPPSQRQLYPTDGAELPRFA